MSILKQYQNAVKSNRVCRTCGYCIEQGSLNDYCMLCQYIQRYNFVKPWMPPIQTEAGFFLLVNNKRCKQISENDNVYAFLHRGIGNKQPYIYVNLSLLQRDSITDDDFITKLCNTISHEYWHYLHEQQASKATNKEEKHFLKLASVMLDIKLSCFGRIIEEYL